MGAEVEIWTLSGRRQVELAGERHGDEFDIVYDNTAYHVDDLEPVVKAFRDRAPQLVFTSSTAVYRRFDIGTDKVPVFFTLTSTGTTLPSSPTTRAPRVRPP